jgi:hypothetical protein
VKRDSDDEEDPRKELGQVVDNKIKSLLQQFKISIENIKPQTEVMR